MTKTGKNHGAQSPEFYASRRAETDESDLSEGERRRGGQGVGEEPSE